MKKNSVLLLTVFVFCIFTLPAQALSNIAEDFTKTTPKDTTLFFTSDDFVKNSNPPSGKSLVSIKLNQMPNDVAGDLKFKGNKVNKGSTISTNDLNNLCFVPVAGYEGEAIFTWTANYGSVLSPFPGAVVITIGSGTPTPSLVDESNDDYNKEENNVTQPTENKEKKARYKSRETEKNAKHQYNNKR